MFHSSNFSRVEQCLKTTIFHALETGRVEQCCKTSTGPRVDVVEIYLLNRLGSAIIFGMSAVFIPWLNMNVFNFVGTFLIFSQVTISSMSIDFADYHHLFSVF